MLPLHLSCSNYTGEGPSSPKAVGGPAGSMMKKPGWKKAECTPPETILFARSHEGYSQTPADFGKSVWLLSWNWQAESDREIVREINRSCQGEQEWLFLSNITDPTWMTGN